MGARFPLSQKSDMERVSAELCVYSPFKGQEVSWAMRLNFSTPSILHL